jgi:hypothetical protein
MVNTPYVISRATLAYIDLATGSLLIQLAIAGLVGGIYWAKSYWVRIKEYLKRFKRG